jgi:hypothetical protein
MFLFTQIAYAAGGTGPHNINELVRAINKIIINPLIYFMFVLATIIFIWGIIEYFLFSNEPAKRKTGGLHILWGVIGMTIMIGVFAIMRIITATLGVNEGVFNPQAGPGQDIVDLSLQP